MILNKLKWELRDSVTLMRIFIGWHFLYEGIVKMYNPDWTSFGYLASAQGPLKPLFLALTNPSIIAWVDILNMAALILVGLTLILGFFEKLGAFVGIGLLALYYLAHPSFPWLTQVNVEGSYWFINKNLIELVACMVIYQYPTANYFGLGRIFNKNKTEKL
ncbi:thiosulfate dehydrogenase [quinone] large subunit [Lutibacter oceani]|uniref:Thiosulfate dehydrogenase [quinone] large subunit n=2 Tax=Lutibacter oceani TaxID=1853311 RepID=A0A3D9RIS1_9FLAO|nr:DoxX family membrane protein [Lutibacter oceani]REE79749.1 thiosulfate dehydrogenase [quinone] large subunit [Lutibacter oceani]